MTTKELIQAELDDMSEDFLEELYTLIKQFTQSKRRANKQSLMSKLKSIRIEAPEDFAANHDLYVIGEERAGPNSG